MDRSFEIGSNVYAAYMPHTGHPKPFSAERGSKLQILTHILCAKQYIFDVTAPLCQGSQRAKTIDVRQKGSATELCANCTKVVEQANTNESKVSSRLLSSKKSSLRSFLPAAPCFGSVLTE